MTMEREVITLDSDDDSSEEEYLLPLEEKLKGRHNNNNTQSSTSVHRVSSSDDSDSSSEVTLVSGSISSSSRNEQVAALGFDDHDDILEMAAANIKDAEKSSDDDDQEILASTSQDTQLQKKNTRKRGPRAAVNSEERLREREEKRKAKLLEMAIKDLEKAAKKSAKPEACLKSMQLRLDTGFVDVVGIQSVYDVLLNSELSYVHQVNSISHSVQWRRKIAEVHIVENQVLREDRDQIEDSLLVYFPSTLFIDLVHAYTQKSKGKQTSEQTLLDYIKFIRDSCPQMNTITCVTVGLENSLGRKKDDSSSAQRNKCIFKKDVDEAIVALNLEANTTYYSLKDMQEFGQLLAKLTKAIAEFPFKLEKMQQRHQAFSWYAEADSSCPVKIEKGGKGLISLWQQQLAQFNGVGKETAQAIAAKFPSPSLLLKAYDQCSSTKEAENLLKDIVVRRDYGPLSSTRKVGPELSYKIYRLFTSIDGNEILQR